MASSVPLPDSSTRLEKYDTAIASMMKAVQTHNTDLNSAFKALNTAHHRTERQNLKEKRSTAEDWETQILDKIEKLVRQRHLPGLASEIKNTVLAFMELFGDSEHNRRIMSEVMRDCLQLWEAGEKESNEMENPPLTVGEPLRMIIHNTVVILLDRYGVSTVHIGQCSMGLRAAWEYIVAHGLSDQLEVEQGDNTGNFMNDNNNDDDRPEGLAQEGDATISLVVDDVDDENDSEDDEDPVQDLEDAYNLPDSPPHPTIPSPANQSSETNSQSKSPRKGMSKYVLVEDIPGS